jgi:hypothetical protein
MGKHHSSHEDEEEKEPWWRGPAKWIIAMFLVLMLIGMYFPYYNLKHNPAPLNIPSIGDISHIFENAEIDNGGRTNQIGEAARYIDPTNPVIKQTATTISTQSCDGSRICNAKALYYFVRDNIEYVSDPSGMEYIEPPVELLKTGGGDCESGAILLAALQESVGINARIVLIPGHALIRIFMPDAPKMYRHGDWIYLDWTCSSCDFGELSREVLARVDAP